MDKISPKFLMQLVNKLSDTIWSEFGSYKAVRFYINKWHESNDYNWENFGIWTKANGDIDLISTLHGIDGELLLKIAIDLGVETPDFLPSVPTFKNQLKASNENTFDSFQKALKQVEEAPNLAIGLANSTLESVVKKILLDERIGVKYDRTKTLYALTQDVLKAYKLLGQEELPTEVRNIGSSLLNISKNVEALRSDKTNFHGKTHEDYIIDNPLYAYFIVNCVTTVGLFLLSFHKIKFPVEQVREDEVDLEDDLPF